MPVDLWSCLGLLTTQGYWISFGNLLYIFHLVLIKSDMWSCLGLLTTQGYWISFGNLLYICHLVLIKSDIVYTKTLCQLEVCIKWNI